MRILKLKSNEEKAIFRTPVKLHQSELHDCQFIEQQLFLSD